MVTVHREAGMRFVIFIDDHAPAHVHVTGDGNAKIDLVGPLGAPELVYSDGLKLGDVRKALRIVTEQQAMLIEQWRALHG